MRLYAGRISAICAELTKVLGANGRVEFENRTEAELDFESVLKEFLRLERSVMDEARRRNGVRGGSAMGVGRLRAEVAKEKNFPGQDEQLPYILKQLLDMLFYSNNVAEVFADDVTLRKTIVPVLKKHMSVEDDLDREVRGRIKNFQEGTQAFEVEYEKVLAQIRRNKQL